MNEFADLSDEEFTNTYLNPQMHEEYQQSEVRNTICDATTLSP